MKDNIVVAIIGEDSDAEEILFKGFKKFSPTRLILLVKKGYIKKADKIQKNLEKFNVESEQREVSSFLYLEEVFMEIRKIVELYKDETVVINVDCDYISSCLALSSAFVNGVPALGVLKDKIIAYPIMKFSYYNALNEKKLMLLNLIFESGEIESMEKLSKMSRMSLPLIAYHLKGNRDSQGLIEMNLVETEKKNGALVLKLTDLGKLIANGDVDIGCENRGKVVK